MSCFSSTSTFGFLSYIHSLPHALHLVHLRSLKSKLGSARGKKGTARAGTGEEGDLVAAEDKENGSVTNLSTRGSEQSRLRASPSYSAAAAAAAVGGAGTGKKWGGLVHSSGSTALDRAGSGSSRGGRTYLDGSQAGSTQLSEIASKGAEGEGAESQRAPNKGPPSKSTAGSMRSSPGIGWAQALLGSFRSRGGDAGSESGKAGGEPDAANKDSPSSGDALAMRGEDGGSRATTAPTAAPAAAARVGAVGKAKLQRVGNIINKACERDGWMDVARNGLPRLHPFTNPLMFSVCSMQADLATVLEESNDFASSSSSASSAGGAVAPAGGTFRPFASRDGSRGQHQPLASTAESSRAAQRPGLRGFPVPQGRAGESKSACVCVYVCVCVRARASCGHISMCTRSCRKWRCSLHV
eukprot:1156119-Pelagomonas_calceolata.AAC.9